MNKTCIYIPTAPFLFATSSCNRRKELDTQYFTLKYPSEPEARKATEDNDSFNGIIHLKRSGNDIVNLIMIIYLCQSSDPGNMINMQVNEKVNSMMRNADSGDITDTLFKEIPAKKIKFTNATIDGNLLSGEFIRFVNDGITYLIYDKYPKSVLQNAGRGLELFQGMEMTGLKVGKDGLIYSYKLTDISKENFSGEAIGQWKELSMPILLDELKKYVSLWNL